MTSRFQKAKIHNFYQYILFCCVVLQGEGLKADLQNFEDLPIFFINRLAISRSLRQQPWPTPSQIPPLGRSAVIIGFSPIFVPFLLFF